MKMRSVAENEDDSQYWNSLVESEINEFKDGKNDHFAENVSKVESALLQFQVNFLINQRSIIANEMKFSAQFFPLSEFLC